MFRRSMASLEQTFNVIFPIKNDFSLFEIVFTDKVPVPNKARLLKRPIILIFFSGANKNSVLSLTKS